MSKPTLHILYNADASLMGKLKYGYRKISCPKDAPPECAACEITHGGLHVNETAQWTEAKKELLEGGLAVVQSHRDEVGAELKSWFTKEKLAYPAAILENGGEFKLVVDRDELATFKGDPKAFVARLKEKEVVA